MTVKGTTLFLFALVALSFPDPVTPFGDVLQFPTTKSTADYVILPSPEFERLVTSFTICAWIRPRDNGNSYGTWFTYQVSSSSDDNEISLSTTSSHQLLFGGSIGSTLKLVMDEWSHVCDAWSLSTRTRNVYINGQEAATKATASGRKLRTGGVLVLGQDQDSRGGRFEASQVFAGDLYGIQVLDKKLSSGEVQYLYQQGRCGELNVTLTQNVVLNWEDFLDAERHGNVTVKQDTCSQWGLVRGVIDDNLLQLLTKLSEHLIKLEHLTKCGRYYSQWELIRGMIDDDLLEHLIKFHPFN